MFVEDGMRGGISVISHRHSQDNHPSSIAGYNENKENKQILYVDANNLSRCAMMMPLPTRENPLAPERMSVKEEMLSDTQKSILDQLTCEKEERGEQRKRERWEWKK